MLHFDNVVYRVHRRNGRVNLLLPMPARIHGKILPRRGRIISTWSTDWKLRRVTVWVN